MKVVGLAEKDGRAGMSTNAEREISRILITGSADGLGLGAAERALESGHEVIVHVRNERRRSAVEDLVARGARVVVGDLADLDQMRELAEQARALGQVDAVIHNAGTMNGSAILPVNVVAPYVLTALLPDARRHVYLSSSMHVGGHARLEGLDWSGSTTTATYSDAKLLVTTLMAGLARRRPEVLFNAVDPGWVPTRMGGPSAPDDLDLGHLTQFWLATSDDAEALTTGGYWHHQRRAKPHEAVADEELQDRLIEVLGNNTGVTLP